MNRSHRIPRQLRSGLSWSWVGLASVGLASPVRSEASTESLTNAIKLHPEAFPRQLEQNPNWAGAGIQSPNIANVFKRTIYQILFKFQLANSEDCAGCILAIPESVWQSWLPHLGGPELVSAPDALKILNELI